MRFLVALGLALTLAACGEKPGTDFAGDVTPYLVEPGALVGGDTVRTGRVLVVDADRRTLDPAHDLLPPAYRARTPDEIGMVALVRCQRPEAGRYTFLIAKGFAHNCYATLMEWPSRRVRGELASFNQPPGTVLLPFWNHYAARPTALVASAIAELPEAPPAP